MGKVRTDIGTQGENKQLLTGLLVEAIRAADPAAAISAHLPPRPEGRTVVVGAGKASAQMAQALERVWGAPLSGLVVTRYGHSVPTQQVEVVEAAHPVPDAAGQVAAERIVELLRQLGEDDLVIALISGGGSALLPAPFGQLMLRDESETNRALLASGMPIDATNKVRNELSVVKGGRLSMIAHPAHVHTFVVSDVAGDDPAMVASGPTIPMRSSREEVRRLVELYGLSLPEPARRLLASNENQPPLPDDPRLAGNTVTVVASAAISLEAACDLATRGGHQVRILSDCIEGEARDVGKVLAAVAREVRTRDRPFEAPILLLSGGETTVTVRGMGRGGRNSEFLLAFAIAIDGLDGVHALAADTDGIDGSEDNAGAYADGTSAARMRACGLDPLRMLAENDAWSAFAAVGDLVVTGPTGTNVNDFRAILIEA